VLTFEACGFGDATLPVPPTASSITWANTPIRADHGELPLFDAPLARKL
jgi:hypothetical protein